MPRVAGGLDSEHRCSFRSAGTYRWYDAEWSIEQTPSLAGEAEPLHGSAETILVADAVLWSAAQGTAIASERIRRPIRTAPGHDARRFANDRRRFANRSSPTPTIHLDAHRAKLLQCAS